MAAAVSDCMRWQTHRAVNISLSHLQLTVDCVGGFSSNPVCQIEEWKEKCGRLKSASEEASGELLVNIKDSHLSDSPHLKCHSVTLRNQARPCFGEFCQSALLPPLGFERTFRS